MLEISLLWNTDTLQSKCPFVSIIMIANEFLQYNLISYYSHTTYLGIS